MLYVSELPSRNPKYKYILLAIQVNSDLKDEICKIADKLLFEIISM
jgi:hypothetical protein